MTLAGPGARAEPDARRPAGSGSWRHAVTPLGLRGLALLGLMLGALTLHVPGADTVGSDLRKAVFVAMLAAGAAVYLDAVRLVLRGGLGRHAAWLVLGVAAALRLALIPADPFLSSDIYRYVWDGQVQAAGINPYRYVPADPALAGLRDPAVFPHINRADYARTIYPPTAQVLFAAVGRLSRGVTGMKVAMVACEVVAVLCLLRLLSLAGLPAARVLIYAWNPLALWSFACDGHVDAAAIGLLGLALLLRATGRHSVAGGFLAAAALVKVLPIVAAPAFVIGRSPWRPALAGGAVAAGLYGLYLSAGAHVLGFLPAYGVEEGLGAGDGLWLLAGLSRLVRLPAGAGLVYLAAAALGLLALAVRIARGGAAQGAAAQGAADVTALCKGTAILAAVATAAISPHYPWYFAWLALPSVIAPIPAVIWLSAAPVVLYLDPLHERFLWPSLVYLPAAALMIGALWRDRPARPGG